jgi:hypothetical protein
LGLTVEQSGGGGPGTIDLGGDGSQLYFEDDQTFDNATIQFNGDNEVIAEDTTADYYSNSGGSFGTLTFGSNLTIDAYGGNNETIGSTGYIGSETIINDGTINGGGSSLSITPANFVNNGTLAVNSVALTISSDFTNNGAVAIDGFSALSDSNVVGGSDGVFDIATGSSIDFQAAVSGQTINFMDGSGSLVTFGDIADSQVGIQGFQSGDTIDLAGIDVASTSLSGDVLSLLDGGGNALGSLTLVGDYSSDPFSVNSDNSGGTDLTVDTGAVDADIIIAAGTTATFGGYVGSSETFDFQGSTGTLVLNQSVGFAGSITGLTGSDALDLRDIAFTGASEAVFTANAGDPTSGGTLTVSDGENTATINLLGDYTNSTFNASSDGHGGVSVVDPPKPSASQSSTLLSFSQHISAMASMDGEGEGSSSILAQQTHQAFALAQAIG